MDSKNDKAKVVSEKAFAERIAKAKRIRIVATAEQIRVILEKSGYKIKGAQVLDDNDGPVIGNDGNPVTISNISAMLPGSNVFVAKNTAAIFKYYTEKN